MLKTEESKRSNKPMCSCGRPDLYEESLKLKGNAEVDNSNVVNQSKDNNSSVDSTDINDHKPVHEN
jgi:hypothetical protein